MIDLSPQEVTKMHGQCLYVGFVKFKKKIKVLPQLTAHGA